MDRRSFLGCLGGLAGTQILPTIIPQAPFPGLDLTIDSCKEGIKILAPIHQAIIRVRVLNRSMSLSQAVVDESPGQVLLNGLYGNRLCILGASDGDLFVNWEG